MSERHATEITKLVVIVETSEGKVYQVPVSHSLRPLVVKLIGDERGYLPAKQVKPFQFEFITKE